MTVYFCDICKELKQDDDNPCLETPRWLKSESGLICDDCDNELGDRNKQIELTENNRTQ